MTALELIPVEFDAGVRAAIHELYTFHAWSLPSPDLNFWTFEELAALYFRLELHFDVLPDGTKVEFLLALIRAHLQDYLHDEH